MAIKRYFFQWLSEVTQLNTTALIMAAHFRPIQPLRALRFHICFETHALLSCCCDWIMRSTTSLLHFLLLLTVTPLYTVGFFPALCWSFITLVPVWRRSSGTLRSSLTFGGGGEIFLLGWEFNCTINILCYPSVGYKKHNSCPSSTVM